MMTISGNDRNQRSTDTSYVAATKHLASASLNKNFKIKFYRYSQYNQLRSRKYCIALSSRPLKQGCFVK